MGKFESTDIMKGLSTDMTASKTSSGVLEFALNMVEDDTEGGYASRHTEGGCEQQTNSTYTIGGANYQHVGHIDITPDKKIAFLTDGTNEIIGHIIKGKLTVIRTFTNTERFGFDVKYPIQGAGHVRRGTEEVIYWNDTKNPDRTLNLSKISAYENTAGVFQPDLTLFNRKFSIPSIELLDENDSGGIFELGSYRISLYYVDKLSNKTEVFYISNQIHVSRGNSGGKDELLTGAWNNKSANFTNNRAAYDTESKSFLFKFTNIDPNYDKLVVVATKYTDGNATPVSSHVVETISISERTEVEYLFDGIDNTDVVVDTSTITASYARYESSQYMLHIQNRLVRGNLTEKVYDWAKAQRFALTAQVKWVAKDIPWGEASNDPNYKRAKGSFDNVSLMRDEVTPISISYQMKDGQESPCINIIGRPEITQANPLTINGTTYNNTYGQTPEHGTRSTVDAADSWDKKSLTVTTAVTDNDHILTFNVSHLNLAAGDTVERWKVYNTSFRDATAETGYVASGVMGFHECDTRYPLVRDSDNEIIYPHTIVGGNPVMDKIRHHRLPTTAIAPIASGEGHTPYGGTYTNTGKDKYIYPMGIRLFNLQIPTEIQKDVVGIRIYFGDRTSDYTIVDKGMGQLRATFNIAPPVGTAHNIERTTSFPAGAQGRGIFFNSMDTAVRDNRIGLAEYAHTCAAMKFQIYTRFSSFDNTNISNQFSRHQHHSYVEQYVLNSTNPTTAVVNAPINDYASCEFNSAQTADFNGQPHLIRNSGFQQREVIINTGNNGLSRGGAMQINRGDTMDTFPYPAKMEGWANYVSLKRTKDVYNDLQSILYKPADDIVKPLATTYDSMGNHCFISRMYHFVGYAKKFQVSTVNHNYYRTGIIEFFVESTKNSDMRGYGTDDDQKFYPANADANYFLDGANVNKYHKTIDELTEVQFLYNRDYDILRHPALRLGIDNTISWDNDKRGKFPVRVAWSAKSQDEQIEDFNLQFAALDYDDLSLNRGELRLLIQKPNKLYAVTDYSIFAKPTNAQSWQMSGSEAYLKTSKFLDIPETELYDTGSGYGGCQSRFATIDTEFGTAYVNQEAGEVYLLGKNIVPLHAKGLNVDLKRILPSKLKQTFKEVTGDDYPHSDTSLYETYGLGVRCFFDPIHKRLIINKTDYEFNQPFGGYLPATGAVATTIYWDKANSQFKLGNGTQVTLNTGNVNFKRKHLTLSYSFKSQLWMSWHSWTPKVGFNDTQNLYTMPRGNAFWFKHVRENYLRYYDNNRMPFVLEFVTSNMQRGAINQLNWLSRAGVWSDQYKTYLSKKDETFTQAYIYNKNQTTGLMDLVNLQSNPFGWVSLTNTQKAITRNNNIWRLNNFWDMRHVNADVQPPVTQDWANANYNSNWYNGFTGGYIDKVPNTASYDMTKSKFGAGLIDNEHTFVRLIYNNQNFNTKLSVDLLSLFKQRDFI